jgi:CO/xanthine dehydrogenase FAD-binding subunit
VTPTSGIPVVSARSLGEALSALAETRPKWTVVAGGTDVMVFLDAGALKPDRVLDIWRLRELRYVREEDGGVAVGALSTYSDLIRAPLLQNHAPDLVQAALEVGAAAIQNRGTLAGSIANASPAGDPLPVLLAADAQIEVRSAARGARRVPASQFFVAYRKTALGADELITAIHLPRLRAGEHTFFRKVGTRRAQAIAKMVVAARAGVEGGGPGADPRVERITVGVGCAAPVPIRAPKTEALVSGKRVTPELIEEARRTLAAEVSPIDDLRSTAVYRRKVAGNLIAQFLAGLRG